jgi:P27 family predicted phage terminase small subunit
MTERVPAGLSRSSQTLFRSIVGDYVLEAWHVRLLTEALRSLDRAEQARETISREGLTAATRLGEVKAHPLLMVERDQRAAFARMVKQLGLDLDGPPPSSARRR